MSIDINTIRAETPGCSSVTHLNNAGSSLPPAVVLDAVVDYLETEARIGGYEIAADRAGELDSVYTNAAALLGGQPENWAFVESATRAWNAAFSSLRFRPGDRVVTTKAEYPSNMGGLLRAREIQGVEIVVAPDDEHGQVDVAALESMLDDRTRLVSVTHVPTQGGLINPAAGIGEVLRDTPILYQVDTCQSVGQLPVHVDEIGCDILSFTGRKFIRGPRCTGMVWANDAALAQMSTPAGVDMQGSSWTDPMTIEPFDTARRFEPYEVFFAGKVGLAVALEYAASVGIDNIAARNSELAARLRNGLSELPGVVVRDKGIDRSAIVTFTVECCDPPEIQASLRSQGINVSTSTEASARLDFPERGLQQVVRASVHYFNTDDEIDAVIDAISAMATAG
ncbi:MAG: aminotransferase class V-fold PLP-dependent enzyme [Acidimicrobiia bacterium]|nr:aminotransferase class V-fold PLP-dependent enzyme [Acidimicrobiia bacterium]